MRRYATYVCYAGCDLCGVQKGLTVQGKDDTLFCSEQHRSIYEEDMLKPPTLPAVRPIDDPHPPKMTRDQKILKALDNGHRIYDIMAEYKVSYENVKRLQANASQLSGIMIRVNEVSPFRCSCGCFTFNQVFRTSDFACITCGCEYSGDPIG